MIECKRTGAVSTIVVNVPFVHDHRADFLRAAETCFGNGQPRIVLDLRGTPLMDSDGLEVMLDLRDRCQKLGGAVVIARPNSLCAEILRINGLDCELNVFDDYVAAVGSFSR